MRPPASFDLSNVRYAILEISDLPPQKTTVLGLDDLRALPIVRAAHAVGGIVLRVDDRRIPLPADLGPGGSARIDALGRLTIWSGGMAEGSTWDLPGGPILLAPSTHHLRVEIADPSAYPGDLAVRASRLEARDP